MGFGNFFFYNHFLFRLNLCLFEDWQLFPLHKLCFVASYPCDKQGYCNRLPMNCDEFKFPSVSCTLGPEVTNKPGTAKVLGSNLTRTCFF